MLRFDVQATTERKTFRGCLHHINDFELRPNESNGLIIEGQTAFNEIKLRLAAARLNSVRLVE
jgi:hypothetical protein